MSDRFHTVLLLGPPGSGKGTQGKILGAIPGFFHCACGDVFRRINPNTELGRVFIDYSSRGELVPDEVTIRAWCEHIRAQVTLGAYKPESDVLVLDGIPRNVDQARLMEEHIDVSRIIELYCGDEEKMIERLRRRALKENRMDDTKEEVIRNRWDVYRAETEPVLAHYDDSLISRVDAIASPAEVFAGVLGEAIPVQNAHYQRANAASAC